jgi:hypothetical protein
MVGALKSPVEAGVETRAHIVTTQHADGGNGSCVSPKPPHLIGTRATANPQTMDCVVPMRPSLATVR